VKEGPSGSNTMKEGSAVPFGKVAVYIHVYPQFGEKKNSGTTSVVTGSPT